ncbi:MAG: EamA family transporter [Candidatus Aenigmarchaeota archaeon]|nr:EamA family transporter [Candidatus Aenigmarchaeota archaeon]
MSLALGVIFGIISMISFGISTGITKVPLKSIGNQMTIFFRGIFMSLIIFLVLLFYLPASLSPFYLIIALVIGAIGYFPLFTFYKGLKRGKIGVISPVSNSSIIFTVLFSIVFFGETLNIIQSCAIVLIIIGVFLISVKFRDLKGSDLFKFSSGIPFALMTCLGWGLFFFLVKIPVTSIGPVLTAFIIEFVIMILAGINLKASRIPFKIPDRRILLHLILLSVFGSGGAIFFNMGISVSSVSIVAALSKSSPWVTILYGRVAYKEKLKAAQYVAILLILAGVILISYF